MAKKQHNWTYKKDGGELYPVAPGQVWKVGAHVFVCSDLVETRTFDDTLAKLGVKPNVVYSDPPWNASNLSSFRTKAAKDRAEYTIWQLYERVFGLFPDVPHFVEGGIKEIPNVNVPGPVTHRWPITYYRKHPCVLHYSGRQPFPASLDCTNVDDDFTPGLVMAAYGASGIVVDPCAGRGLTARTAAQKGWTAYTNEMNRWRMSAAMHSVEKIIGVKPQRVS